jgi:hypothetical protein
MEKMENEANAQQARVRKAFREPSLRIYGHISSLTRFGKGGNVADRVDEQGKPMGKSAT